MSNGLQTTGPLAERPRADVRRVLFAAASNGRNLAFAGAVGLLTFGLALGGLPALAGTMLVFGVLVYVSLVGLDAVSPKFVGEVYQLEERSSKKKSLELATLEPDRDPSELRSPHLRRLYEGILGRHEELRRELERSDQRLRERLGDTFVRCTALAREAETLVDRGDVLFEYLGRQRREDIQGRANALEAEAAHTDDPRAAETFRRAATLQWEHLSSHLRLEGAFDRVKAQLGAVLASIEGACARAVHMRAADPLGTAVLADDLDEKLDALESELGFLEAGIDEVSSSA